MYHIIFLDPIKIEMFSTKNTQCIQTTMRKCATCDKQPVFGFECKKPIYCSAHKANGMIDVVSKPDGLEKQNAEFNRRLAALKDEFARSVATVPDEEIEIVRL